MASLCKRQQCTIERRGFRQELDSWRHKLIHCVGKLAWHCVCACVWRGPGGRTVPVTVFSCGFCECTERGCNVHWKSYRVSVKLSFLLRRAVAWRCPPPSGHIPNVSAPSFCPHAASVSRLHLLAVCGTCVTLRVVLSGAWAL